MKAVIAAAGIGTRFLPFTKATPKEMLPIIDKPVIQIIVEDLVAAGVKDIIIVTSEGKEAIEDHFTPSPSLNAKLRAKGKDDKIAELEIIERLANFTFVHQVGDKYGTSVPVDQVRELLTPGEPFFYFFADDFYRSERSQAQQLLDVHEQTGGGSVLSLIEIDVSDSESYGMADVADENGKIRIHASIEKPKPVDAPSNMAITSGFLLSYDVLNHMDMETPSSRGEFEINEAVTALASSTEGLWGCVVEGTRHDTGKKSGYLEAVVDITLEDPVMGPEFKKYLANRLKGDK